MLVDLDLRRPYVAKFFDLQGKPGLTDVARGRLPLREALTEIDLSTRKASGAAANGRRHDVPASSVASITADDQRRRGSLRVLTSGPMPPDTGEFVASERVKSILASLKIDSDVILVDAPPLLSVSDALAITRITSSLVLVARMGIVRRPMIKHARRVLDGCPVRVLGCVVTGVTARQQYGYGYGYGYGYEATNRVIDPLLDEPKEERRASRPQTM